MSTTRSHGKDEVKRYFYYTTDTLVDSGADVNARDEAGDTPLHYAAYFGELAVIRLLVERGADVSALNSYGRTPRSWGRFKTRAVEEYLLSVGG